MIYISTARELEQYLSRTNIVRNNDRNFPSCVTAPFKSRSNFGKRENLPALRPVAVDSRLLLPAINDARLRARRRIFAKGLAFAGGCKKFLVIYRRRYVARNDVREYSVISRGTIVQLLLPFYAYLICAHNLCVVRTFICLFSANLCFISDTGFVKKGNPKYVIVKVGIFLFEERNFGRKFWHFEVDSYCHTSTDDLITIDI